MDEKTKEQIKILLSQIQDKLDSARRLLDGQEISPLSVDSQEEILPGGERVLEGVFDGEKMIGADGQEYLVPANYASKSKLVEGDVLKLTITHNGSFIYKQIGPAERKRLTGELVANPETGQWTVLAEGRAYKVINASVSFFRGKSGDQVVLLVPVNADSDWGAVENIIH
ncbi:MAG TPA: hypothetical protein VJB37_02045 [Patescibacteria group bacterium]|nr:hypothetical protein [Patescibacteria group bacterium]